MTGSRIGSFSLFVTDNEKGPCDPSVCLGLSSVLRFELVCVALRIGDCDDDDVKQCIASQIIELASDGERNPDVKCEINQIARRALDRIADRIGRGGGGRGRPKVWRLRNNRRVGKSLKSA
jgi:hypothetical protein